MFNIKFILFFNLIFILLFLLPFSPLIPLSPSNHRTVVHVHESFFLFCSIPPPPPHQLSSCSPSMSPSAFSLLVQFVHQIPHMSEIIQYLSFSDWIMSLSIMFSMSIQTVAKGKIFFFFMTKQYFTVQVTHSCFIYSSIDGHLGCFHNLAIVNNSTMNLGCLCSFKLVFWIPWDIFPEV